jgi:hypothetical protein
MVPKIKFCMISVPFIPFGWFSILDDWAREGAYFIDRGVYIN